jgi:hypothetical protein
MDQQIIDAAHNSFRKRLLDGNDVGAHTRNAQSIAKDWRLRVFELDPDRFQYEVPISPEFDQRIDVLDRSQMCAYEFKVSGKNATAEFYKDVVKILLWNERRKDKIEKLVFITEESWGRKYLDTPMPKAYIAFLQRLGLEVLIVYITGI